MLESVSSTDGALLSEILSRESATTIDCEMHIEDIRSTRTPIPDASSQPTRRMMNPMAIMKSELSAPMIQNIMLTMVAEIPIERSVVKA